MGKVRAAKFQRPEKPRPIKINQHHIDIVDAVYKFKFLTIEQIAYLTGRKETSTITPVRHLYDNKYLLRPLCQRNAAPWQTDKIYHSISTKGAELLRQEKDYIIPDNRFDEREKNLSIQNFKHDTALADFLITLKKELPFKVLFPHDFDNVNTDAPWKPGTWLWWMTSTGSITPDSVVQLEREDGARKLLFVEIDMGTESLEKIKEGTSIHNKMTKYKEMYEKGMHTETFGLKNMRVLFITTSTQRMQNMIDLAQKLGISQRIFLFSTFKGNVDEWTNNKGEQVKLST